MNGMMGPGAVPPQMGGQPGMMGGPVGGMGGPQGMGGMGMMPNQPGMMMGPNGGPMMPEMMAGMNGMGGPGMMGMMNGGPTGMGPMAPGFPPNIPPQDSPMNGNIGLAGMPVGPAAMKMEAPDMGNPGMMMPSGGPPQLQVPSVQLQQGPPSADGGSDAGGELGGPSSVAGTEVGPFTD